MTLKHILADTLGVAVYPSRDHEASARGAALLALEAMGILLGERILFKTINSTHYWQTDTFEKNFVFISQEAAEYLGKVRVQTIGVDYLSVGGYFKDGPETHRALLGASIWIIEGLNLASVAAGEYELICLPVKLIGSEGAPARAILKKL